MFCEDGGSSTSDLTTAVVAARVGGSTGGTGLQSSTTRKWSDGWVGGSTRAPARKRLVGTHSGTRSDTHRWPRPPPPCASARPPRSPGRTPCSSSRPRSAAASGDFRTMPIGHPWIPRAGTYCTKLPFALSPKLVNYQKQISLGQCNLSNVASCWQWGPLQR